MQVNLSPEVEALAKQAADAAGYEDVAAYVAATIRQSTVPDAEEANQQHLPYPMWKKHFEEFLAHRKATNPNFDDSRESIYFDRA